QCSANSLAEPTLSVTEFILLGFSSQPQMQKLLFAIFLTMYLMTLLGNGLIIILIRTDSRLHTPMYFFLLSFMDICLSSAIVPRMTVDYIGKENTIELAGCATQMFFTLTMAGAECLLLSVMSYDRYVAICKPLQYPILMSKRICLAMSASVWVGASLHALIHTISVFQQPFCESNRIDQFFCTVQALLKLSCSDTSTYEHGIYLTGIILLLGPLSIILASYIAILLTVLQMQSLEGMRKAFGTCLSHLCVVGIFYGAASFKYMRPRSYRTAQQDKVISVFCDIMTPMLNPLIYSLRNRDVLAALRKRIEKCTLNIPEKGM
uniref:Olfactory receptor n=1 Tax=Podarcis muralis TaxID=64176 RepID=A0A670KAY7_PODMU